MADKSWKSVVVLGVLGCVLSALSFYHHVAINSGYQQGPSFCSINAAINCDIVARSAYSEIGGIPVAGIALLYYLTIVVFAGCRPKLETREACDQNCQDDRNTWADVLLLLTSLALVPSIALGVVSVFQLKTVCLICIGMDVVNLVMFLVSLLMSERTRPVLTSLILGASGIWHFFFASSGGEKSRSSGDVPRAARLTMIAIISSLMAVAFFPAYLTSEILFPHRSSVTWDDGIAFIQKWQASTSQQLSVDNSENPLTRDYSRGPLDAPIEIVVFSDFECPFCRFAAQMLERVRSSYEKNIHLVFKNFPLDTSCNKQISHSLHAFACRAAMVARCAGEQGDTQFWRAHDHFFSGTLLNEEKIQKFINDPQVDQTALARCLSENRGQQKIEKDIAEGFAVGVHGTPAVFINGKKLAAGISEQGLRVLLSYLESTRTQTESDLVVK